jgi:tetratricopeptide (TPR) repeat protein
MPACPVVASPASWLLPIALCALFLSPAQEAHDPGAYAALLDEARRLFGQGKFEMSLHALHRCLALRQNDAEAFKLVGLNAVRLQRNDLAEEALKKAEAFAPDDYLVQFNLGALYYTESRFLDASSPLARAMALKPDYLPAAIFLGLNLEEVEQEEKSIGAYRKAIALNESQRGNNELPYLYLGRLLYRMNRPVDAEPLLRRSLEIQPGSGEAWLLLGKTRKALGRERESVDAFERATAAAPRNPEPHYLLSRAYFSQHREQEAQKELERFHELQALESKKNDGRRKSP